jgi:predicted DNA-binding helix-hairpin-helix protein
VIGATAESDLQILKLSESFYKDMNLKRVYYSGYVPISTDNRLPSIGTPVPVVRENRLYQADWLLRYYGFRVDELLDAQTPFLDMQVDPKLQWALKNLHQFPVDINTADLDVIRRVPGIGLKSAQKICEARRFTRLSWDHLKRFHIAVNRARYFLDLKTGHGLRKEYTPEEIRNFIVGSTRSRYAPNFSPQLTIF